MNKKLVIIAVVTLVIIAGGMGFWAWKLKTTSQTILSEKELTGTTTPKTYSEVFGTPIDPIAEPEKHKAAYEKNTEQAKFPENNLVKYPQVIPSGYKLYEVRGTESNDLTFVYKNASGQTIQIFEGVGEIGDATGIGPVETKSGQGWLWQANGKLGLTLSLSQTSGAQIYIIGSVGISKEDLITIADSLSEVYP